jgi:hypothetical protein
MTGLGYIAFCWQKIKQCILRVLSRMEWKLNMFLSGHELNPIRIILWDYHRSTFPATDAQLRLQFCS